LIGILAIATLVGIARTLIDLWTTCVGCFHDLIKLNAVDAGELNLRFSSYWRFI
jgi:hypothetical protein